MEASSATGKLFGHYRIQGQLGAGGMGVVYSAYDTVLERTVAIKVLVDRVGANKTARDLLRHEARAASSLNHPNICTIHEVGDSDSNAYIVMEQVEGMALSSLCGITGLSPDLVLRYGIQIADALAHAHERGVIHRDLKSTNAMITPEGRVKVLDFGLAARLRDSEFREAILSNLSLAESGMIVGTLPYLAPELLRGEPAEVRTDIWALGVLLYEMASGTHPFSGRTGFELSSAILREPPTLLPARVSSSLGSVIMRCLEKSRDDRYQTAREVQSALESLQKLHQASEMRAEWQRPMPDSMSGHRSAASLAARSVRTRVPAMKLWKVAAFIFLVALLAAGGLYYGSHHEQGLTVKDTIVLADFSNTTGDVIFDDTLRQGLSAQLEQSPFLNLLSDERVAQTLALMARPRNARLTHDLAREVCQRTTSAASIEGSISSLGSQYVVGLKAVNCRSGDVLANEQATGDGKEQVMKALGTAATNLRVKLGESLVSVQKYDAPTEDVTTPSLEALQAYSLGCQAQRKRDYSAAIQLFQRAISLDPNFAMAYAQLGTTYSFQGQADRAAENIRTSYELRERVSDREKFHIASHYEQYVTGNLEAARETYDLWARTYPRDLLALLSPIGIYAALGDYDKTLASAQEALKLDPGTGLSYTNLVGSYLRVNRLDEARATAREAESHKLDNPLNHLALYGIDFLQHDVAGMEREAAILVGKPGFDALILYYESDTAAYAGRFSQARELTRRASESAQREDQKETAAAYEAESALREGLVGNISQAKQQAHAALALSTGKHVEALSAIALGLAGDAAQAGRLASDLAKHFPEDTLVQFNYLPTIQAATALHGGSAAKAIEALAPAGPYELGSTIAWNYALYPVYLRGEAYVAVQQGPAAAEEFQKILNHPGVVVNGPIGALAHLGLARAYGIEAQSAQGADADAARAKARAAYQDLFALWKDADSNIPAFIAAKSEYAKLK